MNAYAIPGLIREKKTPFEISTQSLINVVVDHVGMTFEEIICKSNCRDVVIARHSIILLLYTYTRLNKSAIARILSLDHTTVISALKTFPTRIEMEDPVRAMFEEIKSKIFS